MVAALFMGAAIRPRPVFVKHTTVIPGRERSERTRNLEIPGLVHRTIPDDESGQIVGFHGAGITR
jgi:hypothetical protein